MSKIISCGILLYRIKDFELQFFLVHPGGPYNKKAKWGIPKGHCEDFDKSKKDTALREFQEETGYSLTKYKSNLIPLGSIRQNNNKIVHCFALELDLGDDFVVKSNYTKIEYPKNSGTIIKIKEIDDGAYFNYKKCKDIIIEKQIYFIDLIAK